jgi:hypothetical protein
MKARCLMTANKSYQYYGGRGITVCERWMEFEAFYQDMGDPANGMELDRIDNSKGYSPDNCRWVTHKENSRNTRRCRYLECNGERLLLTQWAEKLGISHPALHRRLKRWPLEKALAR